MVLVLVLQESELLQLGAVDPATRVVVLAWVVWGLAGVQAPDVLHCFVLGEVAHRLTLRCLGFWHSTPLKETLWCEPIGEHLAQLQHSVGVRLS